MGYLEAKIERRWIIKVLQRARTSSFRAI